MQNQAANQIPGAGQDGPLVEAPSLRLEKQDIGDLDTVLREYYLAQIKKINPRSERKMARRLLENHLVLPKSRQRTSKDAAYINETLGIEDPLLNKLEQFRLIRRLNKSQRNPIYEISHDSLVEPILAERRNREAIARFIKKYGKWFVLLLFFLFGGGMVFENVFNLMDDKYAMWGNASGTHREVALNSNNHIFAGPGTQRATLRVPFGQVEDYHGVDSLTLLVDVDVSAHPQLSGAGSDTLLLDLGLLNLPMNVKALQALINGQRDTAIPLSALIPLGDSDDPMMASVAGTAVLKLAPEMASKDINSPAGGGENARMRGSDSYSRDFGKRYVQATDRTVRVQLDTLLSLAELVQDDKVAYDVLKGRNLRLTYEVDVLPGPKASPTTIVSYKPVSGVELQYEDGTKRLISPGTASNQRLTPPSTHTVQPGETLYKISKQYEMTMAQLRALNNLPDNTIKVGQVLRLQ
ncbi:MAG: LysM peptidoglycan-binding domain-containing protein [Bacteroidia bacterium]